MPKTFTLYINAYTPATIPMARLAKYMESFAALLGSEGSVHFDQLVEGSTQLKSRVDHEDVPKVRGRLHQLNRGEELLDAAKAQEQIDRLLADDNATGFIYEDEDVKEKIIAFPGCTRPKPVQYGPFNQEGSLDGVLVSIGGTDKTIHLQLRNGDIKYTGIETDAETARLLGKNFLEPIRIYGTGRWLREEDGTWTLRRFQVRSFVSLRNDQLVDAIEQLREVPGSGWAELDDPIEVLEKLRKGDDGPH